jgi:sarcosine oxidase subunit alpha
VAQPRSRRVSFDFDGEAIDVSNIAAGKKGLSIAAALVSAGKMSIARSPKFHRPRGPSCFRGACDGCLARVDGRPNVLTCMTEARAGMSVESQNTLGTRSVDLLRVTDWFFPEGMNHHELFAGVPGVSDIMQAFARRVAGLGRLPKDVERPRTASRRECDVLVVGGGASGLSVGVALAKKGRRVEIVDDALEPGGSLRSLDDRTALTRFLDDVDALSKKGVLRMRARTVAGAVFGDDVLIVDDEGTEVLVAHDLVLAPGAHDGVLAFEGNDVPGVMSARALGLLFSLGVVPGKRACIVKAPGGGTFADAAARMGEALGVAVEVVSGEPVRARGTSRVKSVVVKRGRAKDADVRADVVAIDSPSAPAYELCEQAGATLAHEARGYVVQTSSGKIRDGVWALGEACGTPFDLARIAEEAERVAAAIARQSSQSSTKSPKRESPPATASASKPPSKTK